MVNFFVLCRQGYTDTRTLYCIVFSCIVLYTMHNAVCQSADTFPHTCVISLSKMCIESIRCGSECACRLIRSPLRRRRSLETLKWAIRRSDVEQTRCAGCGQHGRRSAALMALVTQRGSQRDNNNTTETDTNQLGLLSWGPVSCEETLLVTFCVSRRRRQMYCGHARLCVCLSLCLSAAVRPHYCTDPDVTWRRGRGCPLVVHY